MVSVFFLQMLADYISLLTEKYLSAALVKYIDPSTPSDDIAMLTFS